MKHFSGLCTQINDDGTITIYGVTGADLPGEVVAVLPFALAIDYINTWGGNTDSTPGGADDIDDLTPQQRIIFEELKRIDADMAQVMGHIDSLMERLQQARVDYAALDDARELVQREYDSSWG